MSKLAGRLRRLESIAVMDERPRPCPECGRLPNGRLLQGARVLFRAGFTGDADDTGEDNCRRCGAQVVLRLAFDDRG